MDCSVSLARLGSEKSSQRSANQILAWARLELARLAAQDPKSCVSANSTTRPVLAQFYETRRVGNRIDINLPNLSVAEITP